MRGYPVRIVLIPQHYLLTPQILMFLNKKWRCRDISTKWGNYCLRIGGDISINDSELWGKETVENNNEIDCRNKGWCKCSNNRIKICIQVDVWDRWKIFLEIKGINFSLIIKMNTRIEKIVIKSLIKIVMLNFCWSQDRLLT